MRPKNVFTLCIIVFMISGLLVNSVFADPPKAADYTAPVEIPQQASISSSQEVAEPPSVPGRFLPITSMYQESGSGNQTGPIDFAYDESLSNQTEDPSRQTALLSGSSLPIQTFINSLPADQITIDMAYDVVMGWVGPDQLVQVTYGTDGYGSAVADGIGFFWTPIWHNTDGHSLGIDCGTSLSVSVEGSLLTTLTPSCFTDTHVIVSEDLIRGTLSGAGEGVPIAASLGEFNPYVGSTPPAQGAPAGSGTTDSSGFFEITDIGFDLGAESVVALDFQQSGVNIRDYVIPQEVFMVHQMNSIMGYTAIGQHVIATVYEGTGPEVRWTGEMDATWPFGFYIFSSVTLESGDLVTVELSGGPTLSSTVATLGNFTFDSEMDNLHGEAANGAEIRTILWQWQGESHNYSQENSTADSTGFSIDFSPEDLRAYDNVLVITTDTTGNQTQILSGAPFVGAVQDPLSDLDVVDGRMNAPYASIFVSLDKGEGETYTRETTWTSDAGNDFNVWFIMRDLNWSWGPINFDPGDIVTLSDGAGWSISVPVLEFDWAANPDIDQVSGTSMPAGDIEILLYQWLYDHYPLYGTATQQAAVSSGAFAATFTDFDLRDGQSIQLNHYDTNGNENIFYAWGQPSLPYFELQLAHNAVQGVVSEGDTVTATLYANESATTPLVTTSDDFDDDPTWYWLGDFGTYSIAPGMKIVVSTNSWEAEMIVPDLSISGDYVLDMISGSGQQGLLFVEAFRDNEGLGLFIPKESSDIALDTAFYGYDLRQGDTVALTYQAPDGNRARQEVRIGDLYYVGHWFNMENRDWMWGEAVPNSTVTISVNGGAAIPTYFEDDSCPSCWGIHEPMEINPGDEITIVVDTGFSLTYTVPSPLTATANSDDDTVSGQIGGRANDWVNIRTWWDGMDYEVTTNSDGSFILQTDSEVTIDVPRGGEGRISFNEIPSDTRVEFNQYFRTPDLMLDIFPDGDFIQGVYESGHTITLEVYDNTETLKATATMTSGDMNWGNGLTGFDTNISEDVWDTERPDIIPGDHILGWVDAESYVASQYTADARVGAITGEVDADTDSISGTINAPWLLTDPPEEINVECYPWGSPGGAPDKFSSVIPDGDSVHTYYCEWDPNNEWDVDYNQDIGVAYREPEGHRIVGVYNEPSYDLFLNINYDHDWIEGNYPPGYEVTLTVTESDGETVKATTTIITTEVPWWGGATGFSTSMEGVVWDPERPDIQPGDWVFGEVTVDETTYSAAVQLGTFEGELSAETDSYTGKLSGPSLDPEVPIPVQCHPWGGPDGTPQKDTSVLPDGISEFTCDWTGEWDVQPGQEIAVLYLDPAGHWVYSVPIAYTDDLILRIQYDHDWIEGNYESDHEIFLRVLDSLGVEKAHITLTTGLIDGWGSTTGFSTNMEGAQWHPNHPDIQPGDTIYGEVDGGAFTAEVTIGTVTADLDLNNDQVSGTVDAEWLPQSEEVKVSCEIWDWNSPPNKEDWVLPTGEDPYLCDWSGDGYDLNETSNLMVAYYESAGHKLIGEFRYPAPRLRIEKWLEGGEPGEGGNVTFNIQYRNEGNANAVSAIITDTFVQGLTYLSDTSGLPKTEDGNQVIWQLGDLAPGDWVNFYVFAHVDATEGNDIINTAVISSDGFDAGNEEDRTRTWQGTVIANNTHVNVGKGTWTWLPAPGQDYVYNINVCNNGPTGSTQLTLTETLPGAVTLDSWWGREAGWSEVSYTGNVLTLEHPSIPGWTCREVYVKVTLDSDAQPDDQIINFVEVYAENDNPDEQDNESWLYHNVGSPFTDLSVSLGWHSGVLTPGGQYRFGIYFYNGGNVPVDGPLPITVVLPAGVHFGGWSHWDWANLIGDPVMDGNTITWLVDDLDPGYYGTIEVIANIDSSVAPGTELIQTVVFTPLTGEENIDNNTASLTETVFEHGPNLRIKKWGDWHGHGEGHNAWYHLQVENIGDETVEDVLVTDTLPTGMVLDGDIGVGFWEYSEVTDYGNYFTVFLDRLEPGWNVGMDFNVVIPGDDPVPWGQVFTNIATVTADPADTNPEDNSAQVVLGTGTDMFVEKTWLNGDFLPGEQVEFLLVFGNKQPGHTPWWGMMGNAILVDTLPEGMSFVSSYWHCYQETEWCEIIPAIDGQELTWETWSMDAGERQVIVLTVLIDDEIQEGNALINTFEISSDQPAVDLDPFPANNISTYDPEVNFDAPVITSADNTTFAFGEVGSFTITTSGFPTPFIWTDDGLPSWLTLVDQGDGTAILSGTPPEEGGVDYILLKAANGVTPNAEQSFTLTWEGKPDYRLFLPLILR